MKRRPKKPTPDFTMSMQRSGEVLVRQLEEHADAFLLCGIRPDGIPFVLGKATNPAYCIALNAMLGNIVHSGGIQIGNQNPNG